MDKHFINLTNGLEIFENNTEFVKIVNEVNFIYVASTTIENKNYIKLFSELDHNFLFNLAIGNNVIFYDFGTNRKLSKTCYLAIPLIKYCLTRYWLDVDDKNLAVRYSKDGKQIFNNYDYYNTIYSDIFLNSKTKEKVFVKTKLKKYRNKFLITDKINLEFVSDSTSNDGDYEYYKNIIKNVWKK